MEWASIIMELLGPPRKDRFADLPNMFPTETSGSGGAVRPQGQQQDSGANVAAALEKIRRMRQEQEAARASQDAMRTPQTDPNQSPWLMMA